MRKIDIHGLAKAAGNMLTHRISMSTSSPAVAAAADFVGSHRSVGVTEGASSRAQTLSYEDAKAVRAANLSPALMTYYKRPIYVTHGSMQYLWDDQGKKYLDLFGGIVTVSVGHCHPKVNEALKRQVDQLWHTTNIFMHPNIHEYAQKLTEKLPEPLKCVYFVNSGSEANDLAMLMARLYTKNHEIITYRNAYHGMNPYTMGLTAHGPWSYNVPGLNVGIHHAMNPDTYTGLFGGQHCRDCPVPMSGRQCDCQPGGTCAAVDPYMNQFEEVVRYSLPKGPSVAALFAESIQGVGGTVQFPRGYLKKAFDRTRELGGLCVADEVQTGFGRMGDSYWGFEHHGVLPDIVTMAKGIGNGFPLAAVVTSKEIANVMTTATHFNTYGGNPMASAVGIAVLDAIEEDQCQKISHEVGTYFIKQLAALQNNYQSVGDVRGRGLMIGVEMVQDRENKKPLDEAKIAGIWEDCKEAGVLIGKGGLNRNVFRIKPPMCIDKEDVDYTIKAFKWAMDKNGVH